MTRFKNALFESVERFIWDYIVQPLIDGFTAVCLFLLGSVWKLTIGILTLPLRVVWNHIFYYCDALWYRIRFGAPMNPNPTADYLWEYDSDGSYNEATDQSYSYREPAADDDWDANCYNDEEADFECASFRIPAFTR